MMSRGCGVIYNESGQRVKSMRETYRQSSFLLEENYDCNSTNNYNTELEQLKIITQSNNSVNLEDRAIHEWYRFVLSFPPHLVRDYIRNFGLDGSSVVLDPFCGTGTTIVEAKLNHIPAIGLEANLFPHFASTVKVNWCIEPEKLLATATKIAAQTYQELLGQGINDRSLTTHVV
jgi:hypothetical protein